MGARRRSVLVMGLLLLTALGFAVTRGSATSSVLASWKTVYPASTLGTTYSCTVCHTSAPAFNPYGNAISTAWLSDPTASAATVIRSIESLDSDGDGFSNLTEITANTLPGDASSHPAASDTTPPSAPTNLVATAASSTQINLTWTASADNVGVTGYRVYRGATFVGSPTTTSYSDTGLTPATAYSYTVKAVDAANNLSAASNTASATTPAAADTTPPTAPTNLAATPASSTQVNLAWTASTDNVGVASYRVYRGATLVGSPTTTSYSDTGLTPATAYSYTVKAVDAANNLSAASNTASATTPAAADTTPPSAPTNLAATPASSTQVNLTWTASTDNVGVTGYRVYRGATLVGSPTTTSYSDTGLTPATAYSYTVKAIDAANNLSAAGNTAPATTLPDTTGGALDAAVIGIAVPERLGLGATGTASVTMQNTGTTTWSGASGFGLGAQDPASNEVWGGVGTALGQTALVAPGEQAPFTFEITAPSKPGVYTCDWQMIQATGGLGGDDEEADVDATALTGVWFGEIAQANIAVTAFLDVGPANWAWDAVESLYAAGLTNGYGGGSYGPSLPVSRDQMAVYLARALAGGDGQVPASAGPAAFPDVPAGHWAYRYIEYIAARGIATGYWDGYHPADLVTRDQMAAFVARGTATAGKGPQLSDYVPPSSPTFADVPTDSWAYRYVEYLADPTQGVVQGFGDGAYHPTDVCTRDQMAVYLVRAFKLPAP